VPRDGQAASVAGHASGLRSGRPLWDSYKFAAPAISKTYGRNGISWVTEPGLAEEHLHSPSERPPGLKQLSARTCRAFEEQTMLDLLMLALAAGLFALAIGYTYACERL
jgi:hypothetical protein